MFKNIVNKRILIIFVFTLLCIVVLCGRMIYISQFQTKTASTNANHQSCIFGSGRGEIYDCNNSKLVETYAQTSDAYYLSSKLTTVSYFKRYSSEQPACHIIGYLNPDNKTGAFGIEKDFDSYLLKSKNYISVNYETTALGKLLKGASGYADYSSYNKKSGVVLTLDKDIQSYCDTYGKSLGTGAVVVMDVKTSQIKGMSSFPAYDPNNLADSLNDDNAPFINRCINNYSVGSVFKVIDCAAALENGIDSSFGYDCNGYINCNGVRFNCHKKTGHSYIDMKTAVALSCNTYFINLGQKLGYKKLIAEAEKFGIGKQIKLSQTIISPKGSMPDESVLSSAAGLANFSFGQGELTASPLMMCSIYSTIANNGKFITPTLIKGTVDNNLKLTAYENNVTEKQVIPVSVAKKIQSFLKYTVEKGTGMNSKPEKVWSAGKTATAQTGYFYKNGKEKLITWFIGYVPASNPKYCICVMKENGTAGSVECTPVFKKIADSIYK